MSQNSWLNQIPQWVWWSCLPGFGGLAIVYAGYKSNTSHWIALGAGITLGALAFSSTNLAFLIWISQIVISFSLKKTYLIKTSPKNLLIPPDAKNAELIAKIRGKIDINNCTKDEMVNSLGIPIVFANDIESLQNEGYIFTHIEELHEIAGIPESYLPRLAPMIIFTYDYKKESQFSWKRFNILSEKELIAAGIEPTVARKIFQERELRGDYKSVMDIKRRTKLPFHSYRHLVQPEL